MIRHLKFCYRSFKAKFNSFETKIAIGLLFS